MKCKKCGADLNQDALFCHKCGKHVPIDDYLNNYEDSYEEEEEKPRRGNGVVIALLIVLILLVILGLTALGAYMFTNDGPDNIRGVFGGSSETAKPDTAIVPAPVATDTPEYTEDMITDTAISDKITEGGYVHIAEPEYKTYTDPDFKFSCAYPVHFENYIDDTESGRYTLRANDGEVTLRICAEDNSAGITVQQSLSMFKSKYDGSVEYSNSGESYYAIRINQDGFCYYKYLRSKNKNFYWFEFTYPEEERDIYEGYIQHIYNSFDVK